MIIGLLAASALPLTLLAPRLLASPTVQIYGEAFREARARQALHRHIRAMVNALSRGDENAARELWVIDDLNDSTRLTQLTERRQTVIDELIAADLDDEFHMLNVQWWTAPCCESGPGVTTTCFNADGARVDVQLYNRAGLPFHYMFDIFDAPGAANWGQPGLWAIRDIYRLYPQREEPLFWRVQYAPTVRLLNHPSLFTKE